MAIEMLEGAVPEPMPPQYRAMSDEELDTRIRQAKATLGDDLTILGHHYQREDVIIYADHRGDSLLLAKIGAAQQRARFLVFCGVYFMAETADILSTTGQKVILPDLRAGCSMADMAEVEDLEEAWERLTDRLGETILPVTYVNSSAAIKAFVGRHGGATCTSSNAKAVLTWAWQQKERVLFLPDQHLGRNTAYAMGVPLAEMAVWSPHKNRLLDCMEAENLKMLLWQGHCSVHQKFTLAQIEELRKQDKAWQILVHPECSFDVVQAADAVGSTEFILKTVAAAPPGTRWAIGTEVNLVQRIARMHPEQQVRLLSTVMCPCLTMNRIDRPHLLWSLDTILGQKIVNQVTVDEVTKHWARQALDRMMAL